MSWVKKTICTNIRECFCCLVPLTRPAGEEASAGSVTTTVRFGPYDF